MAHVNTEIRFRISAAQMAVLWAALDLIDRLYATRKIKGGIRYQFPFRMYQPPAGYDRGVFDEPMMDELMALCNRLHPQSKTGGRMHMNAVELRAAVFAIRANISYIRKLRYDNRHKSPESRNELHIDNQSFEQLKVKSHRLIHSLEHRIKRADSASAKAATAEECAAVMDRWGRHLRWMHVHLVYFKPLRPKISSGRNRYQKEINELVKMAERGLEDEGYQPPAAPELRTKMRLFAASARRWREGGWTIFDMMQDKTNSIAESYLARFVLKRLTLEELKK